MIHVEESIHVHRGIRDVFRYVSLFSNIEQWDPGVVAARKKTPGPVRAGSEFEIRCSFLGLPFSMAYRVTELSPPHRLVLQGRGETIAATDTISFHETPNGTRIDYSLVLDPETGRPWVKALLGRYTRIIGRRAVKGLADAFNSVRPLPEMRPLDLWMDKAVLPGMLSFSKIGYILRKRKWHPLTESLEGRTVVVTGATSGLGKAAALACARMGANTIVVGRNAEKTAAVCRHIINETGNEHTRAETADLSIKAEIRALAERLDRKEPFLHVLVNNAGALFDVRRETAEGIERSLAINLVGPFLLTELLLPKLAASAPARIVNVASGGMYTQRLAADDLAYEKRPYSGEKAYAQAKRGLVVLSALWAKRYRRHGIAVSAMHPGWVDTPGIRKSLPGFYRRTKPILRTAEQGADTIVWLAAAREAAFASGEFWFDRRPHTPHVLPGTRESAGDRERFSAVLARLSGVAPVNTGRIH